MIISNGRAHHARAVALIAARSRHSGRDLTAHPQALSVCERVSVDLALSRYRTKGEPYPLVRGRSVNILV